VTPTEHADDDIDGETIWSHGDDMVQNCTQEENCSTKRTACTGEGTRTFAGKPAAKRTFTKPYIIMKKE
jgi:hypothetical protein